MPKKIITFAAGTLILFVWNAISWMALPFHTNTMHNIPEDAMQEETLRQTMPESGVYHYPGFPDPHTPENTKAIEDKLVTGPRIMMMVYKTGPTTFFNPMIFLISLLLNFFTVVLTFFLISRLERKNLKSIMAATFVIGLIAAFISDVSLMNWYMFPLDYTMVNVFDKLVTFALLGLLFGLYTFKRKEIA